jgi:predicted AAA+ superfamily ATPase
LLLALLQTFKRKVCNHTNWKTFRCRSFPLSFKEFLRFKGYIYENKLEIKSLIKASNLLKCKDLLIITWDYEDEKKENNKVIKFIPLWKWLLEV